MLITLAEVNEARDKEVEVNLGDKVRIYEWDRITVEGIVQLQRVLPLP
ncbi:hypothetical protein RYX45_06405 [Alkalihalophilus pseudofirmus]|uniref:Uncharacterized protein n=1 Tax=Alkalihalophilus pseudofirmus TaxID=79885 RepID=A0AAJ2KTM1_ALKPS|nr:hypothetical protein [Alkalihalophilus pseudofirmus]MDV2884802.1 hypothetical protein [Alkalihalophilus pseudofirmus]